VADRLWLMTRIREEEDHTVAKSFCFYRHQTSSRNSDGVTPAGAVNTGGV